MYIIGNGDLNGVHMGSITYVQCLKEAVQYVQYSTVCSSYYTNLVVR